MGEKEARRPAPRGLFTAELGEAFLLLMRETGNARASARALGHRHLFNNRMRRDPVFRRACEAAARAADARLRRATGPFLAPVEVKAMPPDDPPGGDPGPDPKKAPEREPVIRRTSNGRMQISYVREGGWTSDIEADFLARLRATGNFDASARAVGFQPSSVYRRMEQWPAFAQACREALDAAEVQLDFKLVAHAHALLRRPAEREDGDEEDIPFDPDKAMQILGFLDRRRGGRTAGRPRKGPPERSFEAAVESITGKVEAIERHEAMMAKRRDAGEAP
jgi:hypothetical protein